MWHDHMMVVMLVEAESFSCPLSRFFHLFVLHFGEISRVMNGRALLFIHMGQDGLMDTFMAVSCVLILSWVP